MAEQMHFFIYKRIWICALDVSGKQLSIPQPNVSHRNNYRTPPKVVVVCVFLINKLSLARFFRPTCNNTYKRVLFLIRNNKSFCICCKFYLPFVDVHKCKVKKTNSPKKGNKVLYYRYTTYLLIFYIQNWQSYKV